MPSRPAAILLSLIIALQALVGVHPGGVVLCLGGGHQHTPDTQCQQNDDACGHEAAEVQPIAAAHDNCGCVDIELTSEELLATLRGGNESVPEALPCVDVWVVNAVESGLTWRGPPVPLLSEHAGAYQRAIVASVRLII